MVLIYIFQHLISVIILLRLKNIYSILSIILSVIIFKFKPDTYDIITYTKYVKINSEYELLFNFLITFFLSFTDDNRLIITFFQFFILSLSGSIIFFFRNNKLLILAAIISSVAVMLALHNNLRQGTASLCILISILFYLRKNKLLSLILVFVSFGFHSSSIYITGIIIVIYLTYNLILSIYFFNKKNSMNLIYITSILLGLFFAILLIFFVNELAYATYFNMNFTTDNERTPLWLKVIILTLFSLAIEVFLLFKRNDYKIDFFRFSKNCLLFFVMFLSVVNGFDEIGARILYFYYILELGLLCCLLDKKLYLTSVLIILGYALAFNVWNILGGI